MHAYSNDEGKLSMKHKHCTESLITAVFFPFVLQLENCENVG